MARWKNAPLELFHGTDSKGLSHLELKLGRPVQGFSVDLKLCRENTDFGRGFYMTTSAKQARNWANTRVRRRPSGTTSYAVILAFKVDRDWLASLDTLCFVLPDKAFFNLVDDCRGGIVPHQRKFPKKSYDVVFGPVTLWPQDMVVGEADQVSIHTAAAAARLPVPHVFSIASSPSGLFARV